MNDAIDIKRLQNPINVFGLGYNSITRIKSGSINNTYLIQSDNSRKYILQCMNKNVFQNPELVINNILLLSHYYKGVCSKKTDNSFINVVLTKDGHSYYENNDGFWRCFDYIDNAYTADRNPSLSVLYEVGKGIAQFHTVFLHFPVSSLATTIPNFHDIIKRYENFLLTQTSFTSNVPDYNKIANYLVKMHSTIYNVWNSVRTDKLPSRVTHNDTSLPNIMIDSTTNKFRCLIDLDTVMQGSFIYDFGDCARSILEKHLKLSDFEKIKALDSFCQGYADAVKGSISESEVKNLYNGIWIVTLELCIRFLYDYTQGNVYFSVEYENQNIDRAKAQFSIFNFLTKHAETINDLIRRRFSEG